MKRSWQLLLLFLSAFIFFACEKEDRQEAYPSLTTVGANLFASYIDNDKFLPCKTLGGLSPVTKLHTSAHFYDTSRMDILVSAINDCDLGLFRNITIVFDSIAFANQTTYTFGRVNNTFKNTVSCQYTEGSTVFESDSSLSGHLTIMNFDWEKRILSAKFEAALRDINSSRTVQLKQGLFDVRF